MPDQSHPTQYVRTVLVVDDDHELAEMFREVLTFDNCSVDIAANGMEALDHLRTGDYDAIICDLMMPRVDGQELYEETVKRFPYLANKFLFVTGQPARTGGMTDFISRTGNRLLEKPVDIDELRSALKELFRE